ncbi:PREDICTED: CD70 antigen [Miniopterus natalensis]|uniref:CD70 antigen n=1 Tax=Miniopterus natalensis TaxID=291302 RepID=UPI0007A6ED4D|nr:PREDICTED: CD70 antigen [Miniopterus natalensis]
MAEEGAAWLSHLRARPALGLLALLVVVSLASYLGGSHLAGQHLLQAQAQDVAELQLNHTGLRQDPRLSWQGGPALGRSFLHGAQLDKGQLRVQRDGIYRLHIQVTLTNCSSSAKDTVPRRAILTVGICSPATHSISLLRLNFGLSCTVSSQRLTPLARGDTLCTNLTLPLLPSQNSDETFFGVQWIHP